MGKIQQKDGFMNGQCFNFAYAMCQFLEDRSNFPNLYLVAATSTRNNHEYIDQVCIHCVSKIYDFGNNYFVYLDAQGLHCDGYLEKIVEAWKNTEFELTGFLEETTITEYIFSDENDIKLYWNDLKEAGAKIDLDILAQARQYILRNTNMFQKCLN